MRILGPYIIFLFVSILLFSCDNEGKVDQEKPEIDFSITDGFPQNCATVYFDVPFTVKTLLTDNEALGSFSIDIHHNFDHHTHSTEPNNCTLDADKTPINPFIFIEDYEIPGGSASYETDLVLTIPLSDGVNQYDEGDYHFNLSVTDQEGWSKQVGLNIKILQ